MGSTQFLEIAFTGMSYSKQYDQFPFLAFGKPYYGILCVVDREISDVVSYKKIE